MSAQPYAGLLERAASFTEDYSYDIGMVRGVMREQSEAISSLLKRVGELEGVLDEFLCSIEMLERHGPHLTCADGEFVSAAVLTDRAEKVRAALNSDASTQTGGK